MNDDNMAENGKISVIIKNKNLDFDLINTLISVNATKIIRKGEELSKVLAKSENDIWIFEEPFDSNDEINKIITDILKKINFYNGQLSALTKQYDVELKCFIQSDYAQMYFELLPRTIEKIAQAKIKFSVSIFSWGQA